MALVPRGGRSDGSAHGGDMSGCPSQQHWRKPTTTLRRRWELNSTTLHGARRPPVRGRGSPEGSRAAGGSHGRVRGCPGAVAGRAAAGRRGRRGCGLLLEEERKKKKLPRGGRAHRRQRQWYVHGWFCLFSSRCVPFRCRLAQDAPHRGRCAPKGQLCSGLVLLVSCRRQATDASHHGRYGPEGAVRGAVQKSADFPKFHFIVVLATIDVPQLRVDTVVDPFLCRSCVQFFNKVGDLPVAPVETPQVQFLDEVMVISTGAVVQTVQTVWKCRCSAAAVHRRSSTSLSSRRGCFPRSRLCRTKEIPQLLDTVIDFPVAQSCRSSSLS